MRYALTYDKNIYDITPINNPFVTEHTREFYILDGA